MVGWNAKNYVRAVINSGKFWVEGRLLEFVSLCVAGAANVCSSSYVSNTAMRIKVVE
jgi:hypothetical protein